MKDTNRLKALYALRCLPFPEDLRDFDISADYEIGFAWGGAKYRYRYQNGIISVLQVSEDGLICSDLSALIEQLIRKQWETMD